MGRPDGNEVFIDTTALYALLDPAHDAHDQVAAAWDKLRRSGTPLMTSSYVCAEMVALVQARLGSEKVRAFLDDVKPHVTVLKVDSGLHGRALTRGKRDLGALIPRTSRALMSQLGVRTVFSLDGEFVGEPFRRVELAQRAAQPPADEGPGTSSRSSTPRRPPRRHGARRGARSSGAVPSAANRPPPPPARPELICRRAVGSWQWEIVLSAPDECNVTGVRHHDIALRAEEGEYRLSSLAGVLSVDHADGTATEVVLCTARAPMIFKLADRWSGVGRRIDAVSRGHFVVIVPKGWNRTGPAPVAPEATADPAFQAHYLFRDGDASADGVGFEECKLALTRAGFSLTGERLYDDSTGGELFIGRTPELRVARGVTWARVGEEKDGGWRGDNFLPAERVLAEVLGPRQGRFFVRVYDISTKLCDNGEFRYVGSLREILVNGKPYTRETVLPPASEGHTPITVRFVGEERAAIRPSLSPNPHHRWVEDEGAIVAEPHPAADELACSLETPSGSVDVSIRLPRIWWCLGRDGEESAAWCATPLAMTRSEFRNYANSDRMIRIRLPRELDSIDVGFDQDLNRTYRSTLTEDATRIVELPLIDFADYSQVDSWLSDDAVLHARCDSSIVSLVRVMADSVPKIVSFYADPAVMMNGEKVTLYWQTRNAMDGLVSIRPAIGVVPRTGAISVAPHETTRYELSIAVLGRERLVQCVKVTVFSPLKLGRLRAYVTHTYGRGRRPGRGFSLREIHAAGLTTAAATQVGIGIDWRRRTSHGFNIDALRRVHRRA